MELSQGEMNINTKKKSKWNSRSTVLSLLGLALSVLFFIAFWKTNERIIDISYELAKEGKIIPVVYNDIIRSFPLAEVVIGTFTIITTKIGGDRFLKYKNKEPLILEQDKIVETS